VCVCVRVVCVCVCVYIHTCIYIYTCIYLFIHIYLHIYKIRIRTWIHTNTPNTLPLSFSSSLSLSLFHTNTHAHTTHKYNNIHTLPHTTHVRSHIDSKTELVPSMGVATISRLLKTIGLFGKRALWKRRYSAKETYNFMEPTNRSATP